MSSRGHNPMVDEKRIKRKILNRESARRSRMKREQHVKDLNDEIFYFKKKIDEMVMKIKGILKGYAAMEMENMVLRTQTQELQKRLEYAKNLSRGWYEGDDDLTSMGVFHEPWLKPWEQHQPFNSVSLMPSAGAFQF